MKVFKINLQNHTYEKVLNVTNKHFWLLNVTMIHFNTSVFKNVFKLECFLESKSLCFHLSNLTKFIFAKNITTLFKIWHALVQNYDLNASKLFSEDYYEYYLKNLYYCCL